MQFYAENIGRWWGNNPILKRQEEIDILAIDDDNAIICECKYTDKPFDEDELQDLKDSALCIKQQNKSFMIFSKSGVTPGVQKMIENNPDYSIITLDDLF